MSLTGLLYVIFFGASMVLALVRHPHYGLYAYVALFYLNPPSRWWGAALPDLRWSLVAAAVTLVATLRMRQSVSQEPWHAHTGARVLICCALWLWVQNIWALSPDQHFEASILFSKYVLLFYLIYRLMQSPEDIKSFLLAHVAGCFYLGWLAYEAPAAERLEGVGGPGIDEANALGMQLATGVMAGAMLFLTTKGVVKWLILVAMPLIVNGIVLTVSRSSFLAVLAGGLALTRLKPPTRRKVYYTYAMMAVLLFAIVASGQFWARMGTMKAGVEGPEEMDASAASRLFIAEAQWRIFLDHPLGVGHRGTERLTPTYSKEEYQQGRPGRASHNTFMTMLSEQGIPGVAMFVVALSWCIRSLSRLKRRYDILSAEECGQIAAIAGGLVCVLIGGIFVDYFKAEVQIWLMSLLAAWLSILRRRGLPTSNLQSP